MGDSDEKFPSQLADRFQVRMPGGMRSRIAKAAAANGRSMNTEIIMVLEANYPPDPTIDEILNEMDAILKVVEVERNVAALRHLKNRLKDLRGTILDKDEGFSYSHSSNPRDFEGAN